jgi:hypothetical protein
VLLSLIRWTVTSVALVVVCCWSLVVVVVASFENYSEAGFAVGADSALVGPASEAAASVVMSFAAAAAAVVDPGLPKDSLQHLFHPVPLHPPYP